MNPLNIFQLKHNSVGSFKMQILLMGWS